MMRRPIASVRISRDGLWRHPYRTLIQSNVDPTLHRHAAATFHEGTHRYPPSSTTGFAMHDQRGPIATTLRWFELPMPRVLTYAMFTAAVAATMMVHFVSIHAVETYGETASLTRHLLQRSLDNEAQAKLVSQQITTELIAAREEKKRVEALHRSATEHLAVLRVRLNQCRRDNADLIEDTERMERVLTRLK